MAQNLDTLTEYSPDDPWREWREKNPFRRPAPKGLGGGQPIKIIPDIRTLYDNRVVSIVYALQNVQNDPDQSDVSLLMTAVPVLIVHRNGLVTGVADAEPATISVNGGLPAVRRNKEDNFKKTPPYVIVSRNPIIGEDKYPGISVERFEMVDDYLQLFPPQHRGTGVRIPLYV